MCRIICAAKVFLVFIINTVASISKSSRILSAFQSPGQNWDDRGKVNKALFLGLHSLFLSLKQRNQIIFNYFHWLKALSYPNPYY